MNKTIRQRVKDLRALMAREGLDAFVFPSTDPHNGEYIPEHWEGRKWISGFNGSAGIAVVTMNEAALWTDSRYFIAAARQLEGTGFETDEGTCGGYALHHQVAGHETGNGRQARGGC